MCVITVGLREVAYFPPSAEKGISLEQKQRSILIHATHVSLQEADPGVGQCSSPSCNLVWPRRQSLKDILLECTYKTPLLFSQPPSIKEAVESSLAKFFSFCRTCLPALPAASFPHETAVKIKSCSWHLPMAGMSPLITKFDFKAAFGLFFFFN